MREGGTDAIDIPEHSDRMMIINLKRQPIDIELITLSLQQDKIVLLRNVEPTLADNAMHNVARGFGLADSLKLQAGFASFGGHRRNIGKYYMSVNKRTAYQFIPPHSEGNSFTDMQLASFYCYENSTDGGESILMNADSASPVWQFLKEKVKRGRIESRLLTRAEVLRAKGLYQIQMPRDSLSKDDYVLNENQSDIVGLFILEVLAKVQMARSRLLDRDVYVYWDSVASIDIDSGLQFADFLRQQGLLKEPDGGLDTSTLDNASTRRIWSSGTRLSDIFACKVTHKLMPGDLVFQNNLTWTHSVSNWTPDIGNRIVAASFA